MKKTVVANAICTICAMMHAGMVIAQDVDVRDQVGMGRHIGAATWQRCAIEMQGDGAKVYELSHLRSNDMPQAAFAEKERYTFDAPHGMPGTRHSFNTESVTGNIGGQGTQMDALGHFAALPEAWDGEGDLPVDTLHYYGGWTHAEVKPDEHGKLEALGVDRIPPIVTSAVLLDAALYKNDGNPLENDEIITKDDVLGMLASQGLSERGLMPGDVLFIHTGWGTHWDRGAEGDYYTRGPGLGHDAALFLKDMEIAVVGLDNPFTDPAPLGMLEGKLQPEGTPPGLPFSIHHENLSQSGIYQIQNAKLDEMAADKVWLSCAVILPLKIDGGAQSPVSPIAIGVPRD